MILTYAFLYLPILALIVFSFNDSPIPNVWRGFTLRWYAALPDDREMLAGLWLSLRIAFFTACGAVVLGTAGSVSPKPGLALSTLAATRSPSCGESIQASSTAKASAPIDATTSLARSPERSRTATLRRSTFHSIGAVGGGGGGGGGGGVEMHAERVDHGQPLPRVQRKGDSGARRNFVDHALNPSPRPSGPMNPAQCSSVFRDSFGQPGTSLLISPPFHGASPL